MSVVVHPLVLFNIADHYTRTKVQRTGDTRAIGVLYGNQEGNTIDVTNSFEIQYSYDDTGIVFDIDVVRTNVQLYKDVYPDEDSIGWYSTGSAPYDTDGKIHNLLQELSEDRLLYLMADTDMMTDIGCTVFISRVDVVDNIPVNSFQKMSHSFGTDEAERITVSHVAADVSLVPVEYRNPATSYVVAIKNALMALEERISFIMMYLEDVKSGIVTSNHAILHDINELVNRLPVSDSCHKELATENNNAMLITLLSQMTEAADSLNGLSKKISLMKDQSSHQSSIRKSQGFLESFGF